MLTRGGRGQRECFLRPSRAFNPTAFFGEPRRQPFDPDDDFRYVAPICSRNQRSRSMDLTGAFAILLDKGMRRPLTAFTVLCVATEDVGSAGRSQTLARHAHADDAHA